MAEILKYYGGSGFESCPKKGWFIINLGDNEYNSKNFHELKEKYDVFDGEKTFWSANPSPELIDGYFYCDNSESDNLPFK